MIRYRRPKARELGQGLEFRGPAAAAAMRGCGRAGGAAGTGGPRAADAGSRANTAAVAGSSSSRFWASSNGSRSTWPLGRRLAGCRGGKECRSSSSSSRSTRLLWIPAGTLVAQRGATKERGAEKQCWPVVAWDAA